MQSPKSRRPHAPGEQPASYGNSETRSGGQIPEHSGKATAKVPKMSPTGPNNPGVKADYSPRPTTKAYEPPSGRPGYVESQDAKRTGGTVHQFPNGSE